MSWPILGSFLGADPYAFLHIQDKNPAIPRVSGMGMLDQYRNNRFDKFVGYNHFNAFSQKKWLKLMAGAQSLCAYATAI